MDSVSSSPLIVETRKNLKSWNKTIHRGFFNGAWRDDKEIISLFTTLKHQVKFANKRVKEDIKKLKIFDRHFVNFDLQQVERAIDTRQTRAYVSAWKICTNHIHEFYMDKGFPILLATFTTSMPFVAK